MASSSNGRDQFDLAMRLKISCESKTIPDLIKGLSEDETSDEIKLLMLNTYLVKYKEELIFAAVFNQELPQCRLLLLDAIELLKEEIKKIKKGMGLEVAEKSIPGADVSATKNMMMSLEEKHHSIDLNNPCSDHFEQQQWTDYDRKVHDDAILITNQAAKLSLDPSPRKKQGGIVLKYLRVNDRKLMKYKLKPLTQPIWRNNRRSWTPELHARFVVVLHTLGGPQVATPKQIRDQMQVDGLTTNQVKSHLQKYRLNWKRTSDTKYDDLKSKLFCNDFPVANGETDTIMDDID